MVSVANPDYLVQLERIETFLVIARRNGLSRDLRTWICREYLVDAKIPKRLPGLLKRPKISKRLPVSLKPGFDVLVNEVTQSHDRRMNHSLGMIHIIFVVLVNIIILIILHYVQLS